MIHAAIVGIGWWGRMLVNAVQGKSAAICFTAGYTRTRATAEGFCAEHSIVLAVRCCKDYGINCRIGEERIKIVRQHNAVFSAVARVRV